MPHFQESSTLEYSRFHVYSVIIQEYEQDWGVNGLLLFLLVLVLTFYTFNIVIKHRKENLSASGTWVNIQKTAEICTAIKFMIRHPTNSVKLRGCGDDLPRAACSEHGTTHFIMLIYWLIIIRPSWKYKERGILIHSEYGHSSSSNGLSVYFWPDCANSLGFPQTDVAEKSFLDLMSNDGTSHDLLYRFSPL